MTTNIHDSSWLVLIASDSNHVLGKIGDSNLWIDTRVDRVRSRSHGYWVAIYDLQPDGYPVSWRPAMRSDFDRFKVDLPECWDDCASAAASHGYKVGGVDVRSITSSGLVEMLDDRVKMPCGCGIVICPRCEEIDVIMRDFRERARLSDKALRDFVNPPKRVGECERCAAIMRVVKSIEGAAERVNKNG